MDRIEIQPASTTQVHRARTGRMVAVDDDVQGIARQLREIRSSLVLEYDPGQDIYVVSDRQAQPDGSVEEYLVTTWDCEGSGPLDHRLLHRVRQVSGRGYDYVAELDRLDAEADRRQSAEFAETMGPKVEALAWALRKDLGRV